MTEPMTDERLAEIREMVWPHLRESWANELLAEVERLREQESRLTPVQKRPETEAVNEAIRQAIRHYQGMVKP